MTTIAPIGSARRDMRDLGPFRVTSVGLGCMNLSHAYGTPPSPQTGAALIHRALDLGITHFDTAALYGFGLNEELLGRTLGDRRSSVTLASKCGMQGVRTDAGIRRIIDGRPATLRQTCEEALRRLRTEVIDLYYLHRWDKSVPIEESIGALAQLKRAGKIRALGLSEVSAATLARAHAEHPIAAVQSEYSLCTRNVEIGVLETCRRLGVALVAFSPLARGFLSGVMPDVESLDVKDIRRAMPRYSPDNHRLNSRLLPRFAALAGEANHSMSQLALAWLLGRAEHVLVIPGTTSIGHLEENVAMVGQAPPAELLKRVDALINSTSIVGERYNAATQAEIDTENFRTGMSGMLGE